MPLQVISKKIEKTFFYAQGYDVSIEGEKAEMDIQTWDKNEVFVQIELVSKHPEIKVAVEDMEKIKVMLNPEGKHIVIRNFVAEADKETVKSSIRAKYTINLPADCPVVLANYFGHANIKDLTNTLYLDSEFTTIGLTNVKGKLGIKTRFGDIAGEDIGGEVNIQAHRSNITLSSLEGKFNIDAKYGTIKVYAEQSLIDLEINADKSDVYFFDSSPSAYAYALRALNGNIHVPSIMDFDIENENSQIKRASFQPNQEISGVRVAINVSFGEIRIGE